MIHAESYHAGYRAGYKDGVAEIQRQARQLGTAPTMMSGAAPARALAAEMERQRDDRVRQGLRTGAIHHDGISPTG